MSEPVLSKILQRIEQATGLYNRLVILQGPAGSKKTATLRAVHEITSASLINVNLELSEKMLELTNQDRMLELPLLLENVVRKNIMDCSRSDLILLDNIELLFDVHIKHDPVRLLKDLSRNRIVVATWSGLMDSEYLIYAAPENPEYRRYSVKDLLIVSQEA